MKVKMDQDNFIFGPGITFQTKFQSTDLKRQSSNNKLKGNLVFYV